MKYYVVEISTGDQSITGRGVYEYDTLNEAVATFHTKIGQAMKSDLFETELVIVVNSVGGVYKTEFFERTEAVAEVSE